MASPTTPDVLCIGEAMALVAPTDGRSLASTQQVELTFAGAESNVAHHLADLGVPTAWVSALGADALGDRIVEALAAAGVDVRWVDRRPGAPTGVFFKDPGPEGTRVLYYRAGSAASTLGPADAGRWPLEGARLMHLSGITPALSRTCAYLTDTLLDRAREIGMTVSFDVNHRPPLWRDGAAAEQLHRLAQRADLVFVGRDEAESLWGTASAEDVAALLTGPSVLVVKDGDREAVEFDRRGGAPRVTRAPARRVAVVEPVGAGDAFAGGYLAAFLRGDDAEDRLALGHSLAAWTLGTSADYRPGHGPAVRPHTDDEQDGA
ncbi:sugar kinase [Georgenia sp. AZ-5]|uniref:sugar kinase n=1 Tax=Georgenia sp. AZ-5 TaxID=3367526 RepID=UPI00375486BB